MIGYVFADFPALRNVCPFFQASTPERAIEHMMERTEDKDDIKCMDNGQAEMRHDFLQGKKGPDRSSSNNSSPFASLVIVDNIAHSIWIADQKK